MKPRVEFPADVQRYLDEGGPEPQSGREEADRFARAIATYRDSLPVLGPEIDARVMSALAARRSRGMTRSWWKWFVQPQAFRLRPVVAAAALVVIVLGVSRLLPPDTTIPERVGAAAASQVLVRFELRAPDASAVTLAGSFNAWDSQTHTLQLNQETGLWTITVPLSPGEHQYLFVIDGERWVPDPTAHAQVEDGFGEVNSVITVTSRGVVRS